MASNTTYPDFSLAFELGRQLERLAAAHRKRFAIQILRDNKPAISGERYEGTTYEDIQGLEDASEKVLCLLRPWLPAEFCHWVKLLIHAEESGLGHMDAHQDRLLHAAVAGYIDESMSRGSVWNTLQLGRLGHRAFSMMRAVVNVLSQSHVPDQTHLVYLSARTGCEVPHMGEGTHIWKIHQTFHHILKVEKHPKSLVSLYRKLSGYIETMPVPQALKADHDQVNMALNRLSNDLSFVNVHDMIGDDPSEHYTEILSFFNRQMLECTSLMNRLDLYFTAVTSYLIELDEDEFFEFEL